MCGRFVAASSPAAVASFFGAEAPEGHLQAGFEPDYNVAPTRDVYAVFEDGATRRVDAFHWGLVPPWAKKPTGTMINARAEKVTGPGRSPFKAAFKRRRLIIPADGFYEWKAPAAGAPKGTKKQPFFMSQPGGEPLAFAGLWELWRPEGSDEAALRSATIITTAANEVMAPIHDRMPVILPPEAWAEWLDPANNDIDALGKLLVPAPPRALHPYPVSAEVNSTRNNGPHLIAPGEGQAG